MAYTTINDPSAHFHIQLYVGNNPTGQSITNDANAGDFQPDWIWIKSRDTAGGSGVNFVQDSTRGTTKDVHTSNDEAEHTNSTMLGSFDSDGFTIGASASDNINKSSDNYVAWQWIANGGTRTTFTESGNNPGGGYQANTTAGFSIVDYVGTGSAGTVSHGLGSTPNAMIVKNRSSTADWAVYVDPAVGNDSYVNLNTTAAKATAGTVWNDTDPTSSVFTVGSNTKTNTDGDSYIAYLFCSKKGYSRFGSYKGNAADNGAFVYTGFKPRLVIIKNITDTADWTIWDTTRYSNNVQNIQLYPNLNNAEDTASSTTRLDMLSTGFKIRGVNNKINGNGDTMLYMAWAENPLVTGTGTPATAR